MPRSTPVLTTSAINFVALFNRAPTILRSAGFSGSARANFRMGRLHFGISQRPANGYAPHASYAATENHRRRDRRRLALARPARRTRLRHARRMGAARDDVARLAAPSGRLARQNGSHPLGLWRNRAPSCPASGGAETRRQLSQARRL